MRKTWVLLALLLGSNAIAKPWNGIEPGSSTKDDVVTKFGAPTKVVPQAKVEILAYFGKDAIKGTSQAQFKVDKTTQKVERIDVFPGPRIDRESVESTFGPACGTKAAAACHVKKITDDFRTYLVYQKLGLAIFLNEDGNTVQSFIYQPIAQATATD